MLLLLLVIEQLDWAQFNQPRARSISILSLGKTLAGTASEHLKETAAAVDPTNQMTCLKSIEAIQSGLLSVNRQEDTHTHTSYICIDLCDDFGRRRFYFVYRELVYFDACLSLCSDDFSPSCYLVCVDPEGSSLF